ncbi:MAG: hypothetical protein R3D88_06935 [Alphaproteobacteria bacterium]|nr:hypothetical protein [Alphaproteobacteria bacterium]
MKNTVLASVLSVLALSACGLDTEIKTQTTEQIGRPAFMVDRFIDAGAFHLKAWERMHDRQKPATLYIEGDSGTLANNAQGADIFGSHPDMPVGLLLASRDKSGNVAHIARPCQYIKFPEDKGCDAAYTDQKRFTPEVINAYEAALDDIAKRYDITGFHLVGYDGGANIAAVLAGKRSDILSLRTVAGNLNPEFTSDNLEKNRKPLAENSVLATHYGSVLAHVPQHHFIGAADDVITPGVYHSYRQMVGLSDCLHYSLIEDADHTHGWTEKWPDLLAIIPECEVVHTNLSPLPPAPEFPGNYNKGPTKFSK